MKGNNTCRYPYLSVDLFGAFKQKRQPVSHVDIVMDRFARLWHITVTLERVVPNILRVYSDRIEIIDLEISTSTKAIDHLINLGSVNK